MSRIADAFARAGCPLPQENAAVWDAAREAGEAHLRTVAPEPVGEGSVDHFASELPHALKPTRAEPYVAARAIDPPTGAELREPTQLESEHLTSHRSERALSRPVDENFDHVIKHLQAELASAFNESDSNATAAQQRTEPHVDSPHRQLAAAVRGIFLERGSAVRSALFCTPPGDTTSDVARRAADLLAAQSGRRIAFVDKSVNSVPSHARSNPLVTSFSGQEWDFSLCSTFDFVIIEATALSSGDLVPVALAVDGVILVVNAQQTRARVAEDLVTALRAAGAHVLGAVLTMNADSPKTTSSSPHG